MVVVRVMVRAIHGAHGRLWPEGDTELGRVTKPVCGYNKLKPSLLP